MNEQSDLTAFFDFNNASFPQNDISMDSIDYNALGALDHSMAFSGPGLQDR
jgi:hypothetical protein